MIYHEAYKLLYDAMQNCHVATLLQCKVIILNAYKLESILIYCNSFEIFLDPYKFRLISNVIKRI